MVSSSLEFALSFWSFTERSRAIILVDGKLSQILAKTIILVGDHFSGKALYMRLSKISVGFGIGHNLTVSKYNLNGTGSVHLSFLNESHKD